MVQRVLARIDAEEIRGRLRVVALDGDGDEPEQAPVAAPPAPRRPESRRREPQLSRASWAALEDSFPPDWSHCYAEVVLDWSDYLERAALLMAPANPLRPDERPTILWFRAARTLGYGVSAGMTRRCFERLDREGITGRVERSPGRRGGGFGRSPPRARSADRR